MNKKMKELEEYQKNPAVPPMRFKIGDCVEEHDPHRFTEPPFEIRRGTIIDVDILQERFYDYRPNKEYDWDKREDVEEWVRLLERERKQLPTSVIWYWQYEIAFSENSDDWEWIADSTILKKVEDDQV